MDPKENYYLSEEDAEWLGLKKSEYLSKLIELLGPTDIGFEEYHKFDDHLRGTIQDADRAFTSEDDGRELRTFVKSYMDGQNFHQVVVGVIIKDSKNNSEVFVPILIFVSRDAEVVKAFSTGNSQKSPVLN